MNNTKTMVILLQENHITLNPIKEILKFTFTDDKAEIIGLSYGNEALAAVHDTDPCILIMDTWFVYGDTSNQENNAVRLVKEVRKKNPNCKIILYDNSFAKIDFSLFDISIQSETANAIEELEKQIQKYLDEVSV